MTKEKKDQQDKQQKLNKDYADFLVEYKAALAQGKLIGGFIGWMHETGSNGIKIPQNRKK